MMIMVVVAVVVVIMIVVVVLVMMMVVLVMIVVRIVDNDPPVQLRFGNGDTDALPLVLPPVPGGLITKIEDKR